MHKSALIKIYGCGLWFLFFFLSSRILHSIIIGGWAYSICIRSIAYEQLTFTCARTNQYIMKEIPRMALGMAGIDT